MNTPARYSKADKDGVALKVGDWVRIVGVPDLSDMAPEPRTECEPIFKSLVGKYKRIIYFDADGFVEIQFRIPGEVGCGSHTVWLEPTLLRKKNRR